MKYDKFINILLCLLNLIFIPNLKCQGSLFEQISDNTLNDNNPNSILTSPSTSLSPSSQTVKKTNNNFQMIVDFLKQRVSNEETKKNFTAGNIANFFAHFLSGNEYFKNIDVKESAITKHLEVKDKIKVKGEMQVQELNIKSNLRSKTMTLTDNNEIIFEDEAQIRIKDSPIAFKAKDIFEVIEFMKFMIKICGNKMDKCDFNFLLKDTLKEDKIKMIKFLKEKYIKMTEDVKESEIKEKREILISKQAKQTNKVADININAINKKLIKKDQNKNNNIDNDNDNNVIEEVTHNTNKLNTSSSDKFKFKEKNNTGFFQNNINKENKLFKVKSDIELEIELELKNYQENNDNDYERFLNSPILGDFANQYYHGA